MILQLLFLFISVWMYLQAPQSMDKTFMGGCLLLSAFSLIVYFYSEKKNDRFNLSPQLLRHSVFFIILYVIVFFQVDIDYILGIIGTDNSRLWIDNRIVAKALALSCVGLNSLLCGLQFYTLRNKNYSGDIDIYISSPKHLCLLGYIMLFAYIALTDTSYLVGGYTRGEENSTNYVIMVLLQSVIIAMCVLYGYKIKKNNKKTLDWRQYRYPLLLLLLYIFVIVISGRRGSAIRIGSLMLIVYAYVMELRINYKNVLLCIVGAVLLFSLVGIMRGDTTSVKEGFDALSEQETIMPATREMANSVNTLHIAVSEVPERIGYNYGLTFFHTFCVLIPGLDRFYRSFLADGVVMDSAEFLTYTYFGKDIEYGLGSSVIADIYISFGMTGVIIVMFILGAFLKYLEIRTFYRMTSLYVLAISFCCYSQFPAVCRGAVSSLFLSVSYSCVLICFFTRKIEKK